MFQMLLESLEKSHFISKLKLLMQNSHVPIKFTLRLELFMNWSFSLKHATTTGNSALKDTIK